MQRQDLHGVAQSASACLYHHHLCPDHVNHGARLSRDDRDIETNSGIRRPVWA